MKLPFLAIPFLILCTNANAFVCPTNFTQINFGNTIEQITQLCGKPDKEEVKEVEPEGPQEWSYYIPQTVSMGGAQNKATGTLKTEFTFDKDGKAVNISVNGIGVGSSTICGKPVALGDSRDQIKGACGTPSFVNKQNGSTAALGSPPPKKKVTTFFYNTTPPAKLIFEDGVLTEKQ